MIDTALASFTTFTVTATGALHKHSVEVVDGDGVRIGAADGYGTVRDAAGGVLWTVPVQQPGRKDRPLETRLDIADGSGAPLAHVRLLGYKVGPRARALNCAVVGPEGNDVARIEADDKSGATYTIAVDGSPVGSMGYSTVKLGFLKRARVYAVTLDGVVADEVRGPLVAALIRFDGLFDRVLSAARRD